jgi:hypothetical protein
MTHTITPPERGTFDDACKRAIEHTNRHNGDLDMVQTFLRLENWGDATFGIESVSVADRELQYLNTGGTYDLTIGQEGDGPVFDTSWGDWAEQAEIDHCEAEGVIRCGNCGGFTSRDEPWDNTRCMNCGRNVSTGE